MPFRPDRLTEKTQEAIQQAQSLAQEAQHQEITPEHLLYALLQQQDGTVRPILQQIGVEPSRVEGELKAQLDRLPKVYGAETYLGSRLRRLLDSASNEMERLKDEYLSTEHLLLAIIDETNSEGAKILQRVGVTREKVLEALTKVRGSTRVTDASPESKFQVLEKYTRDLTALAREGKLDPVIGREQEIRRVIQVLSRRTKNNPVLIGEAGVGKTAIAEGLAQRIAQGDVPESVEDTISILRGLKEKYEVHHGVRITDSAIVAAAVLSQRYITDRFLPDKAIDLIDEAASSLRMEIDSLPQELDELERQIRQLEIERQALKKEQDRASKDRLNAIEKELANLQEQSKVMRSQWQQEKALIQQIRELKARLEQLRLDAERAERMADFEAAARLKYGEVPKVQKDLEAKNTELVALQKEHRLLKEEVDEEDIAKIVSRWTGIPVQKMLEGEVQKLIKMEERLHARVVGQDEAVTAVANAVRRGRAGLSDPNRPIGSFTFLDPTGVGKTELARALAEFLFDNEQAMIRIDMSEYMEKHTVARLVGAPPGYVGYEEGGQITEAVRRRPYSVILFDEIEKAHPDVFNILLQLLEDGRLTDGQGRTVDFRNTVVIMTSNLGSHILQDQSLTEQDKEKAVLEAVRHNFRPEFLNRVDEIIIFKPLTREQIKTIVNIQLERLRKRLAERRITLQLTPAAMDLIANEGYDPIYGARPLKRVIQRRLQDPLAMAVLDGKFREGDTVLVDAEKGELVLRKAGAKEHAGVAAS